MTAALPCALCSEAEAAGARSRASGRGFQSGKGTNGRAAWTVSLSGHCALRSRRGVQTRALEKLAQPGPPPLARLEGGPPASAPPFCMSDSTLPCGLGGGSLYHPLFRTHRGHEVPASCPQGQTVTAPSPAFPRFLRDRNCPLPPLGP